MVSKPFSNRLIDEKSPYLLQHAHNPVNWYPWGAAAFEKAKSEQKPIFLSIGYSTCHWCHVMAHESFEDPETADLLNERFVSIKVDREERPDIDSVYMKVCQMMTGQGGWPLNIFMTPDSIPFYAGTYFPKESKYGMPSFTEVMTQLYDRYMDDPEHIQGITEKVSQALKQTVQEKSTDRLTEMHVEQAMKQLMQQYDAENGGFGQAPKFPQPQNLMFLLRYYQTTRDRTAIHMVEKTLQAMGNGGIYDQVGFGFARYATDEKWLVPHFEKMLYDNALLLTTYLEAYQVTKHPYYKRISEQVIQFLQREMANEKGGFYSAIDADSEGVEGKYYVWNNEEVMEALGSEVGALYSTVYGITPTGNFEGKNIPNRMDSPPTLAELENRDGERARLLEQARLKLLATREERVYPHVDDKILTAWNAMTMVALAKAGRVLQNPNYTNMAERALEFVEQQLFQDGRLMARYRDGEIKFKAYLDDYAYLIWAYIELYETTFSLRYLQKAKKLAETMLDLFWDSEQGGFYLSGKDAEQLIARDKEIYDGALPSGNGVAAVMLVRLAHLTGVTIFRDDVETMYHTFFQDVSRQASAAAFFMQSLLWTEYPTKEIVIIGAVDDPGRQALLTKLQQAFIPHAVILVGEHPDDFKTVAPFAASYKQIANHTTVYICENFSCQAPTTDLDLAFEHIIEN